MKKTLLLAAALACSGVAQAEAYVCTSTYGEAILQERKTLRVAISGVPWIADKNEGLRWSYPDGTNAVYQGECEELTEENLTCSINLNSAGGVGTILINRKDLVFTASFLRSDISFIHLGNCVVI